MGLLDIADGIWFLTLTEPLLQRFAVASAELALFCLVIATIMRVARIRSPRPMYLLWLVVLIKPLFSMAVGSPLPVARLDASAPLLDISSTAAQSGFSPEDHELATPTMMEWVAAQGALPAESIPSEPATQPAWMTQGSTESLLTRLLSPGTLMAIWFAGMFASLAIHLHARVRLHRIVRSSAAAPKGVSAHFEKLAARLGLRRVPALAVTATLESPAIVGLIRPRVLIPAWMAEEGCSPKLDWALRHELTHWKWFDPLGVFVRDAARILFWFHPCAWWAGHRMTEAMELACDRAMLRDSSEATAYAEQLFAMLRNLRERRRPAVAGGLFATRTQVGRRIAALLEGSSCRSPHWSILSVIAVSLKTRATLAIGAAAPGTGPADSRASSDERVLHFPRDRSLGRLQVQDVSVTRRIEDFHHWVDGTWGKWAYIGEAQGDVVIPAGKRVQLMVGKNAWQDLSPLAKLRPDDLYELQLVHIPADNRCMPYVGRLTGLKVLNLRMSNIGDTGLRHLRGMRSLERLHLPKRLTDAGMVHVGELTWLKGLYFYSNRVTDSGLVHLAKLTSLEELRLGGRMEDDQRKTLPSLMTDAGLVHLAKLPRLWYLLLWGDFTDAGLVHLSNIPPLRTLTLSHLKITDAGLAGLAGCTRLEALGLYNTKVTDKGMVHLRALHSLRMLDLGKAVNSFDPKEPPITDASMGVLKGITTLEHLSLPYTGVGDAGLADLSELGRMKHLCVGTSGLSEITDAGLKHIARLRLLENLSFGGASFTAEGTSAIADLPNLRNLHIITQLSPNALASLNKLTSLEHLNIYSLPRGVGISEVNQLSGLSKLTSLEVCSVIRDCPRLELVGMPRLESIRLTMEKGSALGDDDVACLAGMTNLRELSINGFGGHYAVSDAGMAQIAGLTRLERLSIGGPGMTDRGLASVAGFHRLWELNITGNFTDAGLRQLEGLTGLARLKVASGKNLGAPAVARLRKALPHATSFNVEKDRALPTSQSGKKLQVGDPAPPFVVETVDGSKVSLSDYHGKAVLVYFWATWCSPCMASMPAMKTFQATMSKEYPKFAMLSLSMDDDSERFREYLKQQGFAWPQARIGMNSELAADYGVEGAPAYFVIGPDGKVVCTDKNWQEIQKAVAEADGFRPALIATSSATAPAGGTTLPSPAVSPDLLIRPGEGVGDLKFGMSVEQMHKILGKPDRSQAKSHEYLSRGMAVVGSGNVGVAALLFGGRCEKDQPLVGKCRYRTTRDIGMGSSEEEVVAAYGPPSSRQEVPQGDEDSVVLSYDKLRATFVLRRGQVVHMTFKMPAR